jgi:hypothetical protein
MFAKMTSAITAGAVAALALGVGLASAQSADVAPVKVTGVAPTSVTINITGLQHAAVRQLVRVAAVQVCGNAISNRQLSWDDGDWCVAATRDHSMDKFRRLRAATAHQLAMAPQMLTIASR